MPQWNWGPIPAFAARLAATVPRRPNGWRRPLAATRAFGGPWGMLVRDRWTDDFPPIKTPASTWLVALLDRLRRDPLSGTAFPTDTELATDLGAVHRFLVLRNARHLAEVLPGPSAMPPELLAISATGLAWALWTYELVAHGPPNPARAVVPVGPPDWPVPPTAGDSLSLHLWIEELVAADDVPAPPTETARATGGLRRERFLRRFPSLVGSSNTLVRRRETVVRTLLALSPLTQWIYPDLVPQLSDFEGMTKAVSPVGWRDSADVAAARDGWQSLIARSLVAALLGPTAAWERRAKAEDELAALRGQRFVTATLVERKRVVDRAEELRQETHIQGVVRPVRLQEVLSRAGPCGTLLAIRTLDMLVRHLAISCGPLLLRDRSADADRPTLAGLVLRPGNRLFRRLTESIFGGARVTDFDALSRMHAAAVERLVMPSLPTDGALAVVAAAAGITAEQARRVRDRFARVPIALPHPIRDGNPPSPTPAALLAAWCASMKPPEPEPDDVAAEPQAVEE